ncbi:toll/interleukin-1 receptor domain-containing protein [Embleya scabrispora]|uniref:toll/interleukin-1 receptor domain-containing protein n=1 Tax=Embleya scabrispora TaxID=159449 RepID=UPI001F1AD2AB|nr:toll/interleukin-1 receptor domain-containing protein [Embleya scabrispora]
MDYDFFTSHVADRDPKWAARFHDDVEAELRRGMDRVRAAIRLQPTFGPIQMPDGDPPAQARAMVALCSDDYFEDLDCGRDWAVFTDRLRRHESIVGVSAPNLIAVPWTTIEQPVPPAVGPIEWPVGIPAPGRGPSVFDMLRLGGIRDLGYVRAVRTVADRVVAALRHRLAPLNAAEADEVEPMFGSHDGASRTMPEVPRRLPILEPVPPARTDLVISYVGNDLAWADWVSEVLTFEDYRVSLSRWDWSAGESFGKAMARARGMGEHVLALFSEHYFEARRLAMDEWEEALGDGDAGGRLLPIVVGHTQVPSMFRGVPPVDLTEADAVGQRDLLVAAVHRFAPLPARNTGFS